MNVTNITQAPDEYIIPDDVMQFITDLSVMGMTGISEIKYAVKTSGLVELIVHTTKSKKSPKWWGATKRFFVNSIPRYDVDVKVNRFSGTMFVTLRHSAIYKPAFDKVERRTITIPFDQYNADIVDYMTKQCHTATDIIHYIATSESNRAFMEEPGEGWKLFKAIERAVAINKDWKDPVAIELEGSNVPEHILEAVFIYFLGASVELSTIQFVDGTIYSHGYQC